MNRTWIWGQTVGLPRLHPDPWVKPISRQFTCIAVAVTESLSHARLFCIPTDGSPPGSSVCGILQARILEWVAIAFSRGSSWPRINLGLLHCRQILYPLSHQTNFYWSTVNDQCVIVSGELWRDSVIRKLLKIFTFLFYFKLSKGLKNVSRW